MMRQTQLVLENGITPFMTNETTSFFATLLQSLDPRIIVIPDERVPDDTLLLMPVFVFSVVEEQKTFFAPESRWLL